MLKSYEISFEIIPDNELIIKLWSQSRNFVLFVDFLGPVSVGVHKSYEISIEIIPDNELTTSYVVNLVI